MIRFRKSATTEYFKQKVKVALYITGSFHVIKKSVGPGGYEITGTYKDPIRGVYIDVYMGRKVKGIGAGQYNEIRFNWNIANHPEHNYKHLTKQEVLLYLNQRNKKA